MHIETLIEHREHVPAVARWGWEEWNHLMTQDSLEAWTRDLDARLRVGAIPITLLALEGSVPIGSASLVAHDLATRPDLTPWLAEVYVRPEHRQAGVGTALIEHIAEEARTLGVETLYLYTFDRENFYAQRGWCATEHMDYRGENITLMCRRLAASTASVGH